MRIGVLALQGAFREHLDTLRAIGVEGVRVREPADLEGVSGLILPGGESTTMRQLIERWGLHEPILDLAETRRPDLRHVRRDDRAGVARSPAARRRSCRCSTSPSSATRSAASSTRSRPSCPCRSSATRRSTRSSSAPRSSSGPGPDVDVLARLDDGRIVAVRAAQRHRHRVPPRARRRDPLPPARRDDGRGARRSGRGLRPPPAPDASGEAAPMTEPRDDSRPAARSGRRA